LPSCGLALTEAERVRDSIVTAIEERLRIYGLERERLSIRITGCPNGCARPYTGDIGIVGRIPGFYALFVGGDFEGTRLNTLLADKIPLHGIAEVLDPLFALYACGRAGGEGFGDFCHRIGMPTLQQALAEPQKGAA
jgi:sulfite reductase (ferredoxin)